MPYVAFNMETTGNDSKTKMINITLLKKQDNSLWAYTPDGNFPQGSAEFENLIIDLENSECSFLFIILISILDFQCAR